MTSAPPGYVKSTSRAGNRNSPSFEELYDPLELMPELYRLFMSACHKTSYSHVRSGHPFHKVNFASGLLSSY